MRVSDTTLSQGGRHGKEGRGFHTLVSRLLKQLDKLRELAEELFRSLVRGLAVLVHNLSSKERKSTVRDVSSFTSLSRTHS